MSTTDGNWYSDWQKRHVKESWVYRWLEANRRYEEAKAALERNPASSILDAAMMLASGDLYGVEMAMVDDLALALKRAAALQPETMKPILRDLLRGVLCEVYEEFDELKRGLDARVRKIIAQERREYQERRQARKQEAKG